jgi:hypothetical protein
MSCTRSVDLKLKLFGRFVRSSGLNEIGMHDTRPFLLLPDNNFTLLNAEWNDRHFTQRTYVLAGPEPAAWSRELGN